MLVFSLNEKEILSYFSSCCVKLFSKLINDAGTVLQAKEVRQPASEKEDSTGAGAGRSDRESESGKGGKSGRGGGGRSG